MITITDKDAMLRALESALSVANDVIKLESDEDANTDLDFYSKLSDMIAELDE